MQPSNSASVVVAGAGVVGAATACELLKRGFAVTLLEAEPNRAACSVGNAGVIATEAIMPLASYHVLRKLPGMLLRRNAPLRLSPSGLPALLPWFVRFLAAATPARQARSMQALGDLLSDALPAWQALQAWAETDEPLRTGGWLFAYASERALRADAAERRQQRRLGIGVHELSRPELIDLCPALSDRIACGVAYPDAAWCADPGRLLAALIERFLERGGTLFESRLSEARIERRSDPIELRTEHGSIHANRLVVALGADSARLAGSLEGYAIPLVAERGYHLQYAEQCDGLTMPVMFAEHKIVATPMRPGLRLAGTAEFTRRRAAPDYRRADALALALRDSLNVLPASVPARWMGRRPTLPDSLPVISGSQRHPGLFYNFGHQHLGLTLAAASAGRLVDAMTGSRNRRSIADFDIARFARR